MNIKYTKVCCCLWLLICLTTGCSKHTEPSVDKITVTTESVTSIQQTSAHSGGQVSGNTSGNINDKGVCWSTSSIPTISSSKLSAGTGTGSFTSTITGLAPATAYFLRAYATTATQTIYGEQQQFVTVNYLLSSIAVQAISSIKQLSAVSGGVITSVGSGVISAKGICWSTKQNPTTADNKTNEGTGPTSFNSLMAGLSAATTYYIRAYAINEAGTAYSAQISFTTLPITTPTVDDVLVISITTSKATFVSNVSDDGGSPVTDRGFCIAPTENPTITTAGVFPNGPGAGSTVAYISGFVSGTTYYVKAYATNSKGTSYSAQAVFKML